MIYPILFSALAALASAAPTSDKSLLTTLSPAAHPDICITHEVITAYHSDQTSGTVNFLSCRNSTDPVSRKQEWSVPKIGDTGHIKIGSPDARLCLTIDGEPRDGGKLFMQWCLGLPGQQWKMREDGLIQNGEVNECLDMRKESLEVKEEAGMFGPRMKELQTWNCMLDSPQQTFAISKQ